MKKKLLEDLKEVCDIVIIDGTPCELVTDSIILSRIVDSTVVVTAYKETKKEYKKYERAVIDCKWQMKKIDKLIEECNKWTATDWLHWADYNWEPIELNVVRPVNESISEDWM